MFENHCSNILFLIQIIAAHGLFSRNVLNIRNKILTKCQTSSSFLLVFNLRVVTLKGVCLLLGLPITKYHRVGVS